ncbi:MAG: radical SAM family heme chaperone HemW [Clostridia bacterium]|nr:radical SAM family heme chaperone HemW [Clostridia bacterium]
MRKISLYIHIPFCVKKCAYCDFASYAGRYADIGRYMNCLEDEFKSANARYGKLDVSTVFIGGGTPSILQSDEIMRLMAMARRFFHIEDDAEITIEANPGTVDAHKLRDYRASGINRLSFGMQASGERLLNLMGRVHNHTQTVQAVSMARDAGFKNINLDLIYAFPTQTMKEWVDTVTAAVSLKPEHLSMYSLIIEEGTEVCTSVQSGELSGQDDDTCVNMRAAAGRIVANRGYGRYEISNYARPGFECRHNIVYWQRSEYLGIGCAAHSFMEGYRFGNTPDLDAYLSGDREITREKVTDTSAREEEIMLATRMKRGVDISLVEGKSEEIAGLEAMGLVTVNNSRLSLTDKGMDVQNAVVMRLI